MAAYPTTPAMSRGSSVEFVDDLEADRGTDGSVKVRAFYPAKKRRFNVKHDSINLTDRNTLEAFYDANRLLTFTFTWPPDGQTYTCVFGGALRFSFDKNGSVGDATVVVLER